LLSNGGEPLPQRGQVDLSCVTTRDSISRDQNHGRSPIDKEAIGQLRLSTDVNGRNWKTLSVQRFDRGLHMPTRSTTIAGEKVQMALCGGLSFKRPRQRKQYQQSGCNNYGDFECTLTHLDPSMDLANFQFKSLPAPQQRMLLRKSHESVSPSQLLAGV
jgi:hypothetical protein